MYMQSKIKRGLTITFLCIITAAFMILPDNSSARDGRERGGKIQQGDGKSMKFRYKGMSRSPGIVVHKKRKKVIVSPRHWRRGYVVKKLPRGYRRAWHRRKPFYYYRGTFYRPGSSGFIVVRAPIGTVVLNLPVGYRRVWVDNTAYYTYGGVFYRRAPRGYVVVESPPRYIIRDATPVIVQPRHEATGRVVVQTEILNVRSGPSMSNPIIYQIHEGYILELYGKTARWLYVQLPNGEFGWVMKRHTSNLDRPGSG